MLNRKYMLTMGLLLSCLSCFAQKQKLDYSIAPWFNNKKAAVTLTLDDGPPGQFTVALPLLMQHHINATYFVTVNTIYKQLKTWDLVNKAALAGNEIANHCVTHPHFLKIPIDSVAIENAESNRLIDSLVPSQKVITQAYPFGDGGGITVKDSAIRRVAAKYFIGARATQNKPYPFNRYVFAKTDDDYYNVNSAMIADSASMADFGKHIDQTLAAGGWFCPTYHGIADGWIITPEAVFKRHLEDIENRRPQLWIATFKDVVKYHRERNSASLKLISQNALGWNLVLNDTLNNKVYDHPLTVNLRIPKGKVVRAVSRKGKTISHQTNADGITFNTVPSTTPITVLFKR
ncbi:MAG: polysaccharide deacetylase family protein [Mucilaginibacter sp.]|nr:polysaccharide deacetylase family protein [Mucilaginibacter sp.]